MKMPLVLLMVALFAIIGSAYGLNAYSYGDAYASSQFPPASGSSATNMQFNAAANANTGTTYAETYQNPASIASQTFSGASTGTAQAGTDAIANAANGHDSMTYGYTNAYTYQPFYIDNNAYSFSDNTADSWSGISSIAYWPAVATVSGTSEATSAENPSTFTWQTTTTYGMETSNTFWDGYQAITSDSGQYTATTGANTAISSTHATADSLGGNAFTWGSMNAYTDDTSATANGYAQSHSDTGYGPADAYASGNAYATGPNSATAQNENYADTYADIFRTTSHSYGFASATAS